MNQRRYVCLNGLLFYHSAHPQSLIPPHWISHWPIECPWEMKIALKKKRSYSLEFLPITDYLFCNDNYYGWLFLWQKKFLNFLSLDFCSQLRVSKGQYVASWMFRRSSLWWPNLLLPTHSWAHFLTTKVQPTEMGFFSISPPTSDWFIRLSLLINKEIPCFHGGIPNDLSLPQTYSCIFFKGNLVLLQVCLWGPILS